MARMIPSITSAEHFCPNDINLARAVAGTNVCDWCEYRPIASICFFQADGLFAAEPQPPVRT